MKNIYITLVVLVLVIGGLFLFGKGKKLEAPTVGKENNVSGEISSAMPVLDSPDTKEMVVEGKTNEVKEFTITSSNFSFSPSAVNVKKGDKVKITFKNTTGFHDFKIDEYGIATKQTQSPTTEVLEFTADKIGSFEYYCSVGTHRALGMKGTLKVE